MSLLLAISVVFYAFLLLFLVYGFRRSSVYSGALKSPKKSFSVIIPFRNEADHLPALFKSLQGLQYPHNSFEIILINDHSEDNSRKLCENFKARFPHLRISVMDNTLSSKSPKKEAISKAIRAANGTYIITTDADCIIPEHWLEEYNSFLEETGAKLVAGPVTIHSPKNLVEVFQVLDIFSLQTATIGSFYLGMPFMCNGANLCYEKKSFIEVKGFEGNHHIASGDDLFLLQKFKDAGLKSQFLKSKKAIVKTSPQPKLRALISQRIRWASKTTAYKSTLGKLTGFIVLLMNVMIIISLVGYFSNMIPFQHFLFSYLVKFNVDFLVIFYAARFFNREKIMKNYFWSSLIYPFFCSYIGFASLFTTYKWKGRRFAR